MRLTEELIDGWHYCSSCKIFRMYMQPNRCNSRLYASSSIIPTTAAATSIPAISPRRFFEETYITSMLRTFALCAIFVFISASASNATITHLTVELDIPFKTCLEPTTFEEPVSICSSFSLSISFCTPKNCLRFRKPLYLTNNQNRCQTNIAKIFIFFI